MLRRAWRDRLAVELPALREPGFWALLLVGAALFAALLGVLFGLAIEYHDTFLRLRPLVCSDGLATRQFFSVAIGSPLCALFAVLGVGELWQQLDDRRRGRAVEWGPFWLFAFLAVGSAALVLFALGC